MYHDKDIMIKKPLELGLEGFPAPRAGEFALDGSMNGKGNLTRPDNDARQTRTSLSCCHRIMTMMVAMLV